MSKFEIACDLGENPCIFSIPIAKGPFAAFGIN